MHPHLIAAGAASLAALLAVTPAQSQQRAWSVKGSGDLITIADCSNCDEDIGILIECRGPDQPVRLHAMYAAVDSGTAGAQVPVSLVIGSRQYRYVGRTEESGLIGFYPLIDIHAGDPVLAAMQSAGEVRIRFAGTDVSVSLRGARAAIDALNRQCSWNEPSVVVGQAPQAPAPPAPPPPPAPPGAEPGGQGGIQSIFGQQTGQPPNSGISVVAPTGGEGDDLSWFTSDFVNEDGDSIQQLTYGIQETDAVAVNVSCRVDRPDDRMTFDWLADYGDRSPGSVVPVSIGGFSAEATVYQGAVFRDSEEYAGIRMRIAREDDLWTQMAGTNQIRLSIPRGQPQVFRTGEAFQAIGDFVAACAKAQPVSVLPPTPPAAPPAPPTAPAPRQLAAGTLNYLCNDGTSVTARIESMGSVMIAYVRDGAQTEVPLVSVEAPFGNRFSNGNLTLHATDNTAQVESGGTARFCQLK